jgi:hypothetical protein
VRHNSTRGAQHSVSVLLIVTWAVYGYGMTAPVAAQWSRRCIVQGASWYVDYVVIAMQLQRQLVESATHSSTCSWSMLALVLEDSVTQTGIHSSWDRPPFRMCAAMMDVLAVPLAPTMSSGCPCCKARSRR